MFDRLIDLLTSFADRLAFMVIVPQFEGGVVLRFGVRHRVLGPGLHFCWPLVETVLRHSIVVDPQELGEQSLTTKDDSSVTLNAIVTFVVVDVEQILLHVQGERQALIDSAMGIIGFEVLSHSWAEVITEDFWLSVTKLVRRKAKKYGIEVQSVQPKDLTKGKSLRVWNSTTTTIKEH